MLCLINHSLQMIEMSKILKYVLKKKSNEIRGKSLENLTKKYSVYQNTFEGYVLNEIHIKKNT